MGTAIAAFEDYAHCPAPLQRLDARVKLLLLAAYTVAVVTTPISCQPSFAVYAVLFACAAVAGRFPARYLAARMAVVLPFIVLAALFLPFQSAPPGFHPAAGAGASSARLLLFLNFSVKSALGAGAAILVTSSTPFPELLAGLERLRLPRVAVMIFSFTHRYLFVLAEEARRMSRARDSRCYRGRWLGDAAVVGRMIGALFLRGYERGERVYLAMLSRCFEGTEGLKQAAPPLRPADVFALAAVGLLLAAAWGFAWLPSLS